MKQLIRTLKWIASQPLCKNHKTKAFMRFLKWQIAVRINPYPIIYPFVDESKLVMRRKGVTTDLYAGLEDFEEMSFLLHLLTEDDTFLDVGANVGSYTILASAVRFARSITVEPTPSTFTFLRENILLNDILERVLLLNLALGKEVGHLKFTSNLNSMNHVVQHGSCVSFSNTTSIIKKKKENELIDVPVQTLDGILQNNITPLLIKIDVEGFETEVLLGGKNTLNNPDLKAVIIELNGSGLRYGYKDSDIHSIFLSAGFLPYAYEPFTRQLTELKSYSDKSNTIYIRDVDFVKNRIKDAEAFNVLNIKI